MDKTLKVNIITPGAPTITEEIQALHTRSQDGEVEFRANHTPIILSTVPTVTKIIKSDGSNAIYFTSSGIIMIKDNLINFCCDSAETPEQIDFNRAMQAKERAEVRLKEDKSEDIDEDRLKLALARSMSRIEAVNIYKS